MGLQSWMIKSWPIIEWFPSVPAEESRVFLHMSTQVRQESRGAQPLVGSTVWLGSIAGQHAGLAWEWVELRPGVLMLADPNSITTNLCMVDVTGRRQDELASSVSLNRLLHQLPWQEAVCEVIHSAQTGRAVGVAARAPVELADVIGVRAA